MKKLFFAAAMGLTAIAANAQETTGTIRLGIKAGANFSNLKFISGNDEESMDSKIGLHAGAFVNIPVGTMFSVNPELVYSMEGAKEEENGVDSKVNLGYLNLPVLLQYNNTSGFFAETGPQIGFLMNATAKVEFDGNEQEDDIKADFEKTNFSWALGAGYRHTSGIGINARYNLGLSNIAKDGDNNNKLKANTIQLSVSKTF